MLAGNTSNGAYDVHWFDFFLIRPVLSLDPPEDLFIALVSLFPQALNTLVSPIEIIVFIALLVASAIVSGSEVALFSLNATDREQLATAGDRASLRVLNLLDKSRQLLVTILLLNTLINVSAAILAALVTKKIAAASSLPQEIVFALEVVALTLTLLIVSEITPKLIASRYALSYSRRVAGGLTLISKPLYPITYLLSRMTSGVQGIYGKWGSGEQGDVLSSDDLRVMAEIGKDHGSLEEDEHRWIQSLLDFGETTVRTIMVNRLDMFAIPVTASLSEALELIRTCGHSRLPLYKDHLDNIQGIVYAKDLIPLINQPNLEVNWSDLMRSPIFVPLGRKLDDLLQDFQDRRTHIAIVVDEYGGTAGLITLDDVLEEIVGEIEDEHDEARDALITPLGKHDYRVDARVNLIDLNDALKISLDADSYEFETLGGLIFHLAGDIPEPGFTATHDQLGFRVEEVENNRIRLVHIQILGESGESNGLDSNS